MELFNDFGFPPKGEPDAKVLIGLDVHKLTITLDALDVHGKLISQRVIESSTEAIRVFFRDLRGEVHLTCEEDES